MPSFGGRGRYVAKTDRIGVVIADSDKMVCQLLTSLFQKNPSFEAVACVSDRDSLLRSVRDMDFDVVLLGTDLEDGRMTGLETIRQLLAEKPQVRVVLLASRPIPELIVEALRFGARGVFYRTDFDSAALCKCVRRVCQGQIWINKAGIEHLINALTQVSRLQVLNSEGSNMLSAREEEVMYLVAEGLGNREIATKLNLSQHTIKNYLFHIFNKLGISNRVELVLYAMANSKRYERPTPDVYCSIPPGKQLNS